MSWFGTWLGDWRGHFDFVHPQVLWWLLLWPLLALWRTRRGGAPAIRYSSIEPLRWLGHPRRGRFGGFWMGALLLGLCSLTVALARPQWSNSSPHVEASGIDIMLALDVSRSMLAEDIQIGRDRANRIEAVKKVSNDFIAGRPSDRIGMVAFAGRPYLVSPLTLDHDWLLLNLDRVRIGLVEDGTAIGLAVASCANRLKERTDSKSKIIVLLTDGDNNAGQITPLTAAEAAHALGIKIYTIGVGSEGEAPIPVQDQFGRITMRTIPVEVDEVMLKKMAEIGQGEFYRATDGQSLQRIFEKIDRLEKTKVELSISREYFDLFPWFLGLGLLLILGHAILNQAWPHALP